MIYETKMPFWDFQTRCPKWCQIVFAQKRIDFSSSDRASKYLNFKWNSIGPNDLMRLKRASELESYKKMTNTKITYLKKYKILTSTSSYHTTLVTSEPRLMPLLINPSTSSLSIIFLKEVRFQDTVMIIERQEEQWNYFCSMKLSKDEESAIGTKNTLS